MVKEYDEGDPQRNIEVNSVHQGTDHGYLGRNQGQVTDKNARSQGDISKITRWRSIAAIDLSFSGRIWRAHPESATKGSSTSIFNRRAGILMALRIHFWLCACRSDARVKNSPPRAVRLKRNINQSAKVWSPILFLISHRAFCVRSDFQTDLSTLWWGHEVWVKRQVWGRGVIKGNVIQLAGLGLSGVRVSVQLVVREGACVLRGGAVAFWGEQVQIQGRILWRPDCGNQPVETELKINCEKPSNE